MLPVSLIVPTFRRNEILRETLPSHVAQDVSEILIVNDGGEEDPTVVVMELGLDQDPRVRVVNLPENLGSPGARNRGGEEAKYETLLFVDDDVVLREDYAQILFDHMSESGAQLAAGRRMWLKEGETLEVALAQRTRRVAVDRLVDLRNIAFDDEADFDGDAMLPMIGAIMMVERELFLRIRYEEHLYRRTGWREETDFQIRAVLAGAKAMACSHALCYHLPKATVGRTGGQRASRLLRYEWHIFWNNVAFLRRHLPALRGELGFRLGPSPVLCALRAYFGFRVGSKIRHLLNLEGP